MLSILALAVALAACPLLVSKCLTSPPAALWGLLSVTGCLGARCRLAVTAAARAGVASGAHATGGTHAGGARPLPRVKCPGNPGALFGPLANFPAPPAGQLAAFPSLGGRNSRQFSSIFCWGIGDFAFVREAKLSPIFPASPLGNWWVAPSPAGRRSRQGVKLGTLSCGRSFLMCCPCEGVEPAGNPATGGLRQERSGPVPCGIEEPA